MLDFPQLREMTELAERTKIVANSQALDNFAVRESEGLHCRGRIVPIYEAA